MKLIRRISSSLRSKLLLMFVFFTCVPLISVGLISYQKSFNIVFKNSKASTKLVADTQARDIDQLFIDTGKLLELRKNPQVLQFLFSQNAATYENAKDILKTISSYRQTYRYDKVLNITMINLYGRGISERKGVFQIDRNPLRNPQLAYLVDHPDEVLNVPFGNSSMERLDGFQYNNTNVISMISTVQQRITHEVIGFIIIDMDDSIVKKFCDEVTIGRNGFFFVVDKDGNPIFSPSQTGGRSGLPKKEDLKELLNGSATELIDSSEGKPKFIFASASLSTGWKIIGYVPLQEIVEEANSIRQLIIISVGLCIAFALILHFFVSSRLIRPVHVLKNKMQLAASGFLEAKVTPAGTDEIAELGNSFNIMLGKIRTLLDQIIKEQQEIKKAEQRALQAQINPHFLYNTLDSILWMAEAGKKDQVVQLVMSLSRLFRISLSKGKDWITVAKELEHLQSYLTIQRMRYRDILEYEIDVDESLHSYPILKMTLQPIVENAIYHGIKNKRGKGLIRIRAFAEDDKHIVFVVEDNGIGMPPERLEKVRSDLSEAQPPEETGNEVSGGFGLHNVQQRIRLYYGEACKVQLDSEPNEGTVVTIRLPAAWRESEVSA
ncbi:sensor histidine kinase [Paenibacillus hamazuiensis]|uniref:sensor histidine kinase n=1 Tax=Paenibacillus hamazuiensis TaxID=2936508 RepID=UPI00200BA433|nr:sensor histidine kinase [Paenibacillus hamazuiensis]